MKPIKITSLKHGDKVSLECFGATYQVVVDTIEKNNKAIAVTGHKYGIKALRFFSTDEWLAGGYFNTPTNIQRL